VNEKADKIEAELLWHEGGEIRTHGMGWDRREANGGGRSEKKVTSRHISRDLKQTLKWQMEYCRRRLFADVSASSSTQVTICSTTVVYRSWNWHMHHNKDGLSHGVYTRCWSQVQMECIYLPLVLNYV
jgi:hypothetical protein